MSDRLSIEGWMVVTTGEDLYSSLPPPASSSSK
jgi:hypothetical protein